MEEDAKIPQKSEKIDPILEESFQRDLQILLYRLRYFIVPTFVSINNFQWKMLISELFKVSRALSFG